jgi:hypothetical protein
MTIKESKLKSIVKDLDNDSSKDYSEKIILAVKAVLKFGPPKLQELNISLLEIFIKDKDTSLAKDLKFFNEATYIIYEYRNRPKVEKGIH